MKSFRIVLCLSLMICLTVVAQEENFGPRHEPGVAHGAQDGRGGPMKGEMPPELKAQLSDSQISALKTATSPEAKMALLKEWGIKMPERKNGPGGSGGPGGPGRKDKDKSISSTTVTETVEQLTAQYKAATTEADKEAVRDKMRALFHQSKSEDVKQQVRSFFSANRPAVSWQAPQRESSSAQSSATQ